MVKSYFVTIGFSETYLLRLLTETSAKEEDRFVIVVPSPILEGVKVAIENLKVNSSRLNYPSPEVHEISLSDFPSTLSQLIDLLLPLPEPIITELSVGMRMLNTLLFLSILISRKKYTVYVRDEGGGAKVISFNSEEVNSLSRDLSNEEIKMLYSIDKNNGIRPRDLAIDLGKSEKTVLNKLSDFKKYGYIVIKGKDRLIELTPLGKIALTIHNESKKFLSKVEHTKCES